MKTFEGGREGTSFILHTIFVNDADTLNTWQNKQKAEEKRGKERRKVKSYEALMFKGHKSVPKIHWFYTKPITCLSATAGLI